MADPAMALPRLLQLASPALPIGGFSYSQGLEWAIEAGDVHDATSAATWVGDHLALVIGRFDAPLWAAAHHAWTAEDAPAVRRLNDLFHAARETAESRAESVQMGYSFRIWCEGVLALSPFQQETLASLDPAVLPVVSALAAAQGGVSRRDGLTGFVWSWTENQVAALVKALPMGQMAAQRLLLSLSTGIPALVETALTLPEDDWSCLATGLAIAQCRHETQYTRIFRS